MRKLFPCGSSILLLLLLPGLCILRQNESSGVTNDFLVERPVMDKCNEPNRKEGKVAQTAILGLMPIIPYHTTYID